MELLPCPFCGAHHNFEPIRSYDAGGAQVLVLHCGWHVLLQAADSAGVETLSEFWNQRPRENAMRAGLVTTLEQLRWWISNPTPPSAAELSELAAQIERILHDVEEPY